MGIKEDLIGVVGPESVSDSQERLRLYAKDHSLSSPCMPGYVVQPGTVGEIQQIIKLANESKISIVPCSSGIHFNGNTIPSQVGVILDLRRMSKIQNIDVRNRTARIEPGVTWSQLQKELEKHDLMALNPLFPHPLKSVLGSHLEREPMLIPKFEYGDPILNVEVILPNGDLFRSGSTCVTGFPDKSAADGVNPQGPGIDWVRLFQGAQGTMGVVTWAIVKTEIKPKVNKTFFISFDDIEQAIEPIYRVQKRMIGSECLLLNNLNLAAILTEKWPEDFETLRKVLPPWTLILVLAGGWRRPEERIEYEEDALCEIAVELSIPSLPTSLGGLPGVERKIPEMLRNAWPKDKTYWKFGYKGSCQDLFPHTVLARAPEFTKIIGEVAARHGYPMDDIGFYVQPLERARACHYECNFYYNPDDTKAVDRIRNLFVEAAETLVKMGAFFPRPYGPVANMVYDRATSYTTALKKVKGWLDPNNIMSPGRLCF
ncbi:MAG: FAD-binding oxidoreductase [Dehalococcoidia bacterium]|nr:FAD-binding oxidoreductase [Dehalococcoidia bacterium]